MPSPRSPLPTPSNAPTRQAMADTWVALARVQARAYADWLALCMETSARCALTRSVPECMAIGSLMLPSCLSHAMQYCKSLSEVVQAGLPAIPFPAGGQSGAFSLDGNNVQRATADTGLVQGNPIAPEN
jgi:hypothetical protein